MREDEEIVRIIGYAPQRMRYMLASVLDYNSGFNDKLLERILFAITVLDRRFFVENEKSAYDDNALPIGSGQTISQPSTIVRMLLLAELQEGEEVLEVGAGSGWNAALISFLVYPGNVTSVDRIQKLTEKAQNNISDLRKHLKKAKPQQVRRIEKINFIAEDALSKGKVWKKKYNKIIITAGIPDKKTEKEVEKMAKSLLNHRGILICPYVAGHMIIYRKNKKLERKETKEGYVFVPLLEGLER